MLQIFGFLSAFFSISSYIPYLRDVLKRKTKPQRASWLIWSTLTGIAFFSLLAKGASNSLWLPAAETLASGLIFLLAIKRGVGGLSRRDIVTLCAAGIGILLWYVTHEAGVALYIIIAVDSTGTLLTMHKSYITPESETLSTWIICSIGGLFSMLAVGKLDIILLSYPFYIFSANLAIALSMILGIKKTRKRK